VAARGARAASGADATSGRIAPVRQADAESQKRVSAFEEGLEKLGWRIGQTIQIDYRWAAYSDDKARAAVEDLLTVPPDVILVLATSALRAAQQVTRTLPIVFTGISEPVAQGFVTNLANPGGNVTGFTNLEPSVGGKWLELLKEIAPGIVRGAFIYNPDTSITVPLFVETAEAAAARLGVVVVSAPVHASSEIEPTIRTLAREPGTGLLIPLDGFVTIHYQMVVEGVARYRLPAVYPLRQFAATGGLLSYGPDVPDQFRRAAGYVDRILRGEKPANLPVQQPTKYELVINLTTAKALGLRVPDKVLAIADEVIE
jgi:putative tryptophan/tyrosine transport system substrate-binding protein